MPRRRGYWLIAALGLASMTVVGVSNSVRRENGARIERELQAFDWGGAYALSMSSATANLIRVLEPFDAGSGRFSYRTGAHSPGTGELLDAPKRVIAEGMHGAVDVRLRAFDPYTRERGGEEAAEIARAVSLVTSRVWPAEPTPVQIDVHFMPGDAPFSQAKRVDWREGDAYELALFGREGMFSSGVATHELYHALAGRWSLGRNDPSLRPNAAHAYEEVVANLFAACGGLLSSGSLSLGTPSILATIAQATIGDQRFEGVLDDEELARALRLLSRDARGTEGLRDLLARTVLEDVFGNEETIAADSPQGERLLARCRESAANPMFLEFRLTEMLTRRGPQPEPRALGD